MLRNNEVMCIIYYFINKLLLRCNYVDLLFVDWDAKTKLLMNTAQGAPLYVIIINYYFLGKAKK